MYHACMYINIIISKQHSKTFFAVRVIPIWNSLPLICLNCLLTLNLVTSPRTETIFKLKILKHNLANHLTLPSFFLSDIN